MPQMTLQQQEIFEYQRRMIEAQRNIGPLLYAPIAQSGNSNGYVSGKPVCEEKPNPLLLLEEEI